MKSHKRGFFGTSTIYCYIILNITSCTTEAACQYTTLDLFSLTRLPEPSVPL